MSKVMDSLNYNNKYNSLHSSIVLLFFKQFVMVNNNNNYIVSYNIIEYRIFSVFHIMSELTMIFHPYNVPIRSYCCIII